MTKTNALNSKHETSSVWLYISKAADAPHAWDGGTIIRSDGGKGCLKRPEHGTPLSQMLDAPLTYSSLSVRCSETQQSGNNYELLIGCLENLFASLIYASSSFIW